MKSIAFARLALFAFAIPLFLGLSARTAPAQAADDATTAGGDGVTIYHFAGDRPSWVYRLKLNGRDVPVTALPNIDAAACQRIAAEYEKLPPQCRVPAKFVGLHYAHVAAAGDVQVELTASEPIVKFTIHPKRRGIHATADGRMLRFTIDRRGPRYFIVEVNDLPPCCLLVDPPEEGVPSPTAAGVVDAARFLTDATGKVEQTDGFARAIAAVNGTGKTLYVPPGVYLTDTIKIHKASDLGIHLAAGCLIRIKTSPRGENRHAQGIWIDESRRVTISGRGCLDHQAYENFAVEGNRYNHLLAGDYRVPVISQAPVLILRSQDITIRDLTVRNGRNWNYNIVGCDRVALVRCKILTPPACVPEFTDGIDVVSTDGLSIDGCFIHGNDDCFAWGNTLCFASPLLELAQSRELSHCIVRGVVAWNPRANGIRFGEWGTSSMVGIHDILFENCDFCGMHASGLFIGGLVQDPKSPQPPSYGTLRFVNCGFDCDRVKRYEFLMKKVRIERIELTGVVVDVAGKAAVFEGLGDGGIGRLVFRNLTIGGKKVVDLKKADIHWKNVGKVVVE
ncbi:MAG: glycosyl hydrolase family 28 protein [Thermoguttaceae bacterium]